MTVMTGRPEPDEVPSLAEMGMDEVQPGVVEDTFENRIKLRSVGYRWVQVVESDTEDGDLPNVPLLQTIDTREQRRESLEKLDRKSELLVDPDDAYSEYLSPLDLLGDAPVPFWVKMTAKKWKALADTGVDPLSKNHFLARRCKVMKRDGTRCWMWAGASKLQYNEQMCRAHLNVSVTNTDNSYVNIARRKLFEAAPAAADMLEHLSSNAEQESVRMRASMEILDRIGVKGGTEITGEVTVTHVNASDAVRERLDKLRDARNHRIAVTQAAEDAEREGEIVDAELVQDA